ncbi:MAG: cytochrome P450 [Mycobacteriales bacterium]
MSVSVEGGIRRPPGPKLGPLDLVRMARGTPLTDLVTEKGFGSEDLVHLALQGEHYYFALAPELVCDLLLRLAKATGKGRSTEQSRPLLGDGLLTSDGELHRRQRRLIQPAFHGGQVRGYARVMAEEAARLPAGGDWTDGAVRDVAADMAAVTLRIVGRTLFTTDLSADAGTVTDAATKLIHLHQRSLSTGRKLLAALPGQKATGQAAAADLDRVVQRMVTESRERGGTGDSVLAMLLAARDDDGQPMTDRQVRDEVMTLLLAGHETTANALTWTWLLLEENPAAAGRLHAEVDALPGPPTADDLPALPWTAAVLAESMRIYPPAWASGRRIRADVTLGGWTVPAGSLASAVQWLTHRDPRWWADPLAFRPERWITAGGAYDESAPGQPRGAYFPFGMGNRVCIGASFARTEAALVLATLARDWAPALVAGHVVKPLPATILRPRGGLPMVLHRR